MNLIGLLSLEYLLESANQKYIYSKNIILAHGAEEKFLMHSELKRIQVMLL